MQHKCNSCSREFPSLTALLSHKKNLHGRPPAIVIAAHNHPDKKLGKRKPQSAVELPKKIVRLDNDDDLQIVEVRNEPKPTPPTRPPKFTIPIPDTEHDDIKRVLEQAPTPPTLSPIGNPTLPIDYKELYEQLHKKYGEMVAHYKDQIQKVQDVYTHRLKEMEARSDAEAQKMRSEFQMQLRRMIEAKEVECKEQLDAHTVEFKAQMARMASAKDMECEERLKKIYLDHQNYIKQLQTEHQTQLTEIEKECAEKLQTLQAIIKDFENEDDSETVKLSKIIFNCATLEDIYELQSLIQRHQFNQLTSKHLRTLQNLLLGLSQGIVPICEPQRRALSESQKKLVSDIQSSSLARAKSLINNNRPHFIDFMNKIKDSLKLISSSYNRYGGI